MENVSIFMIHNIQKNFESVFAFAASQVLTTVSIFKLELRFILSKKLFTMMHF